MYRYMCICTYVCVYIYMHIHTHIYEEINNILNMQFLLYISNIGFLKKDIFLYWDNLFSQDSIYILRITYINPILSIFSSIIYELSEIIYF